MKYKIFFHLINNKMKTFTKNEKVYVADVSLYKTTLLSYNTNLQKVSVRDLKSLAKGLQIRGYSKLRKQELINLILYTLKHTNTKEGLFLQKYMF